MILGFKFLLVWTAACFIVGIPLVMIFMRHNRAYCRANNWSDDFQFDEGQHPHVERAGHDNSHPRSRRAGAIHQGAL